MVLVNDCRSAVSPVNISDSDRFLRERAYILLKKPKLIDQSNVYDKTVSLLH